MDSGRVLYVLALARRRDAFDEADAWRRYHTRPGAAPLPDDPERPRLLARLAARLPVTVRRHADVGR